MSKTFLRLLLGTLIILTTTIAYAEYTSSWYDGRNVASQTVDAGSLIRAVTYSTPSSFELVTWMKAWNSSNTTCLADDFTLCWNCTSTVPRELIDSSGVEFVTLSQVRSVSTDTSPLVMFTSKTGFNSSSANFNGNGSACP